MALVTLSFIVEKARGVRTDANADPFLVGGLMLISGPGLLCAGFFLFRRRILVCEQGVAVVNTFGAAEACRWDDVDSTFQRIVKVRLVNRWGMTVGFRIDKTYTIQRTDGRRLVFTGGSCHDLDGFWRIVQRETTRRLLAAAFHATTREGREVQFGDVAVSARGVHCGGDFLPWNDVGDLSLFEGQAGIRFRGGGSFAVIPVHQIPNLHVFLNLVESLSGRRWN
jgi:hypothetical protein